MLRQITLMSLSALLLAGCDKLIEAVTNGQGSGSLESQIRISSELKPDIVAAFTEISNAARAHNLVFVEQYEQDQPANGPAYTAGINSLDKAAREHGGLAKQIIDAVAATWIREKDIFIVFDTMHRQFEGMETRGDNMQNQLRAYIQIIDSGIRTYDHAIRHLESGEEPLLRDHFDRKKVPREVADEFLRLRKISGAKISQIQKEMFHERRAALQSFRTAFTQTDEIKWNAHLAEGNKHEQKADQLMGQMIAEIRKQLGSSPLM